MNQSSKKLASLLKDVKRRRDPEESIKGITAPPPGEWKQKKLGNQMISFKLVGRINPAFAQLAEELWGDTPLTTFENGFKTEIDVKQSGNCKRFDCIKGGIFGKDFCYIVDPSQGTLFLDKKQKLFLHLGPDHAPELALQEARSEIIGKRETTYKGMKVTRVELGIAGHVRGKFVLYLHMDKKTREFAGEIFNSVFGCMDKLKAAGIDLSELGKFGVPVRGEFYVQSGVNKEELASEFTVESLGIVKTDPALFSIPKDYTDLRSLKKKHAGRKKGFTYGKPVRYSTLRPRRNVFARSLKCNKEGAGVPKADSANYSMAQYHIPDIQMPECIPSTYGSQLANLVDQKFLDDLKYIANGISRRLSDFQGNNGEIDIAWLAQFETHANAAAPGPGSGLFELLRDNSGNGAGLLDKLAESEARRLLTRGDVSILTLPVGLESNIATVINNPTIDPPDRFDRLSNDDQDDFRDAYLEQRLAHLKLDYPSSTPTATVFHDLLCVRLDNITFDVNINQSSILKKLEFDSDSIHLNIQLPDAGGKAFLSRWPSKTYGIVVGASAVACILFGIGCTIAALGAIVAAFLLLDFAFVSIDLSNIDLDSHIRFTPNTSNVLQPEVDLELDADVHVRYASVIPTGLHQIFSLIYSIIGSHTSIVIDEIESQLKDKLNELLRVDLNLSYPPSFGPIPLTGLNNIMQYTLRDNMYIQTSLNAGSYGIINPYVTQVDEAISNYTLQSRNDFKTKFRDPVDRYNDPDVGAGLLRWLNVDFSDVARYYFTTVFSQNFVNHYIYVLWRLQTFNYEFRYDEKIMLLQLLSNSFVDLQGLDPNTVYVALWPAVPPRTVYTPKLASTGDHYATTFFDDVRLCFGLPDPKKNVRRLQFCFAAQLYTELGFGGLDYDTNQLNIIKVTDQAFDLYFDLSRIGIEIIHPESQFFTLPNMPFDSAFDYSSLDSADVQEALLTAMQFSLAKREARMIPRLTSDPHTIQRYDIGMPAFKLVAQMVPFKQNIYVNMGTSGIGTAIYDGALDIDQLDQTTAQLIRAFIDLV